MRVTFGMITEIFQTPLYRVAPTFIVSQVCCTDWRNMSYLTKLLSVLVFILLYGDHIIFWLAGCVSLLALETGLGSCHGGSNELTGEY
jgi:hypothetical protein